MELLKHECGVAMVRLLKPLDYYYHKYGTYAYGLQKLYLLMEKQHNRGQEAAGIGCVKMSACPGTEYIDRVRELGSGAIQAIFDCVNQSIEQFAGDAAEMKNAPCIGELYMGHLRYSTTGRSGMSYVHPFLRRHNRRSRNLLLCGNFNMTNVDQLFDRVVAEGQHPRLYSDTFIVLEQLGNALDEEHSRLWRQYSGLISDGRLLEEKVADNLDIVSMLRREASLWDGGFVMCGIVGSGDMFVLRDSHGIRPAFYYQDEEIVVVASERPVIQTVMNVERDAVAELTPGSALLIDRKGRVIVDNVLGESENRRCSFERIYFSRGGDSDIYRERKELGRSVVPDLMDAIGGDLENTVFSFIPNTAEVAFYGMMEGLEDRLSEQKAEKILQLDPGSPDYRERLRQIVGHSLRREKIAIKDIKLRTFIAEGASRDELAGHVYDVTYGVVRQTDNLVVIDDSIVRGTTLKQSIIRMLDRLHPKKIVVVSSSPQVRYPDCYGIDMSRMGEFVAFKAAIELLREQGKESIIEKTYEACKEQLRRPVSRMENAVKQIYAPFTDKEISRKISEMVASMSVKSDVELVYQTIEGMHRAIPTCPGDWYFSGDYPTPGGNRVVNRAFVNYFEGHPDER